MGPIGASTTLNSFWKSGWKRLLSQEGSVIRHLFSSTSICSTGFARREGMKFLTGDAGFKGLENVEFVR